MKSRLLPSFIVMVFCTVIYPLAGSREIPQPAIIQDLAEVLGEARKNGIRKAIDFHENKTGNEIAILTIDSLEGEILENYSLRVARSWGIGKKDKDNGVLILIAMQERKIRIEVGYGLERTLTNNIAGSIIDNHMTYWFKRGDHSRGIMEGANAVIKVLEGRYDSARSKSRDQKRRSRSKSRSTSEYLIFSGSFFIYMFPTFLGFARKRYPGFMESRGWHAAGNGFFGDSGFIGFIGLGGEGGFGSGGFGGGGFGGGGASGGW